MNISCIQMDMALGKREENFLRARTLAEKAMEEKPDVLVFPELWDVGFFPREELLSLSLGEEERAKAFFGTLARQFNVNIVAGSIASRREGKVYNTALVFDRTGSCIARYDKSHLFSPMGENDWFAPGHRLCTFFLDAVPCGLLICYDLRFPEAARTLALSGMDVLFVVAQWPRERVSQMKTLLSARAVENQVYALCCNSCATAGDTVYGGNSCAFDPLGNCLSQAGEREEILPVSCDPGSLPALRKAIPVFGERRPEIYKNF